MTETSDIVIVMNVTVAHVYIEVPFFVLVHLFSVYAWKSCLFLTAVAVVFGVGS